MSQGYQVGEVFECDGGVVWRKEMVIFIGSEIRKSSWSDSEVAGRFRFQIRECLIVG